MCVFVCVWCVYVVCVYVWCVCMCICGVYVYVCVCVCVCVCWGVSMYRNMTKVNKRLYFKIGAFIQPPKQFTNYANKTFDRFTISRF